MTAVVDSQRSPIRPVLREDHRGDGETHLAVVTERHSFAVQAAEVDGPNPFVERNVTDFEATERQPAL